METTVLAVYADREPLPGIDNPGPHQLYKNPRLAVETRLLGTLDPDELRVEMLYAGLCGTDVHLVEPHPETGYIKSSAPASIPPSGRVIGHEGVGRVLEAGANVRHVKPGALVTFESIIVCHYCDICRKGNFNQCRNARLLGLEKDGLFGTIVDVPALLTHDVTFLSASDSGIKAAACVEPAGVAYVACQNTRITGGNVVAVFGGGPIGLFAALLAKTVFGAGMVHLVEPVPFRRDLAGRWADRTYDVEGFFASVPGVDVVIEASGDLENVRRIFRHVNANGRIAFLARSGRPITLDAMDHMITNQVTLIGSRGHLCGAFNDILNLYRQGRIPLAEIVTQVVESPAGLARLLQKPGRVLQDNCKVLVRLN